MSMQMLKLHWRAARWPMLPVLIAAFGLPLMAGWSTWDSADGAGTLEMMSAWSVIDGAAVWGLSFPVLAAVGGAVIGLCAWTWDHKHDHIYALSLPIARWKYVAIKFGGGTVLVAATTGVFALGAGLSSMLADLPMGLRAYPGSLSIHFFVATQTAFALLFALASGTIRTATIFIGAVIALAIAGQPTLDVLGGFWAPIGTIDLGQLAHSLLVENDGPLSIFSGNWMLFDV